jgi:hypothetical protein
VGWGPWAGLWVSLLPFGCSSPEFFSLCLSVCPNDLDAHPLQGHRSSSRPTCWWPPGTWWCLRSSWASGLWAPCTELPSGGDPCVSRCGVEWGGVLSTAPRAACSCWERARAADQSTNTHALHFYEFCCLSLEGSARQVIAGAGHREQGRVHSPPVLRSTQSSAQLLGARPGVWATHNQRTLYVFEYVLFA